MEMTSLKLEVNEISQVGEARRMAVALAQSLAFDETQAGKVAIVASEAAGNLVKYARHGELILRSLEDERRRGLEVISIDKGPGMSDVAESLQDGYSTGGSAGIGLGAISRQSNQFEVYSRPGEGTVLLARLWSEAMPAHPVDPQIEVGAICLPLPGEIEYGDTWAIDLLPERCRILLADGLGHGAPAAEAARAAARIFHEYAVLGPAELMEQAHSALHLTRGAVMAVADVDLSQQIIRYCGVGNISGAYYAHGEWRGLVSYEGIVGHTAYRFREFTYAYTDNAAHSPPLLVMHSDGLGSRWNLGTYPGLVWQHPSLIAGVLYRDFRRPTDDVTVVVMRLPETRPDGMSASDE